MPRPDRRPLAGAIFIGTAVCALVLALRLSGPEARGATALDLGDLEQSRAEAAVLHLCAAQPEGGAPRRFRWREVSEPQEGQRPGDVPPVPEPREAVYSPADGTLAIGRERFAGMTPGRLQEGLRARPKMQNTFAAVGDRLDPLGTD